MADRLLSTGLPTTSSSKTELHAPNFITSEFAIDRILRDAKKVMARFALCYGRFWFDRNSVQRQLRGSWRSELSSHHRRAKRSLPFSNQPDIGVARYTLRPQRRRRQIVMRVRRTIRQSRQQRFGRPFFATAFEKYSVMRSGAIAYSCKPNRKSYFPFCVRKAHRGD